MRKVKIGDNAVVKSRGGFFATYVDFFDENNLSRKLKENYERNQQRIEVGDEVEVLFIGRHKERPEHYDDLCVVRSIEFGYVALMQVSGLTDKVKIVVNSRTYMVGRDTKDKIMDMLRNS